MRKFGILLVRIGCFNIMIFMPSLYLTVIIVLGIMRSKSMRLISPSLYHLLGTFIMGWLCSSKPVSMDHPGDFFHTVHRELELCLNNWYLWTQLSTVFTTYSDLGEFLFCRFLEHMFSINSIFSINNVNCLLQKLFT